jgi:hypothetical protein
LKRSNAVDSRHRPWGRRCLAPRSAFQMAWEARAALRNCAALMRTGWLVVRRTARVSSPRSIVTVSAVDVDGDDLPGVDAAGRSSVRRA